MDLRVRIKLLATDGETTGVVRMYVGNEDVGDRLGRDAGSTEAVWKLSQFHAEHFARARVDHDRVAVEQNDVGVHRSEDRSLHQRLRHDPGGGFLLLIGHDAQDVEGCGAVAHRDHVHFADLEPVVACLQLVHQRRFAELRRGRCGHYGYKQKDACKQSFCHFRIPRAGSHGPCRHGKATHTPTGHLWLGVPICSEVEVCNDSEARQRRMLLKRTRLNLVIGEVFRRPFDRRIDPCNDDRMKSPTSSHLKSFGSSPAFTAALRQAVRECCSTLKISTKRRRIGSSCPVISAAYVPYRQPFSTPHCSRNAWLASMYASSLRSGLSFLLLSVSASTFLVNP